MYIFHLVLCYDMTYFFVVSINIYLTWLDLKKNTQYAMLLVCFQALHGDIVSSLTGGIMIWGSW